MAKKKKAPFGWKYNKSRTTLTATRNATSITKASAYDSKVTTLNGKNAKKGLTIVGNNKANKITGSSKADKLSGGNGNDKLYGRKGNDTLYGGNGSDWFCIGKNEGTDTIMDYGKGNDIICLPKGVKSVKSYSTSGKTLILNLVGGGHLKIANGVNKKITFAYSNGSHKTNKTYKAKKSGGGSSSSSGGGKGVQVMKKVLAYLVKHGARSKSNFDAALRAGSGGKFDGNGLLNSFSNAAQSTGGGSRFLKKCGIILNNKDTGAAIGKDAGGKSVKTAKSIVQETKKVSQWKYRKNATFPGVTLVMPSGLSGVSQHVAKGISSKGAWVDASLKLIKASYGLSYASKTSSIKKLNVEIAPDYNNQGALAYVQSYYNGSGKATSQKMVVNMYTYDSINRRSVDGYTPGKNGYGASYLDRTIAHELVHGVMASNIRYFHYLPRFFVEGGTAEVVHGIDDFRKPDIQNNSSSYQASNLASSYKNQVNYYDSNSSSGSYITDYAGGYMVMRYFIKQSKLSKSSTSRMIAAEDVEDTFILNEDEGDVISVRLDDTGANALVTTDTGTVTVEGGANRLLNIVDGDGVKATYLAEAGLDGSMANEQGVSQNNDHMVASAVQQDVTPDKEYTYLDLNSPAFGQEVNTLNASGSQEDHLVLYGRYNQADLLLGANNGTTVFDGYGGNDTLCGGQGIDIFYWRPQTQGHDCTGDTTIISYTSGQDAIQFFGASSGASVSGYTVSGDDVILYNSQNNATFTVKDVSVDELTIVDAEGKELTAWKQGTSAVATLPDDETTESSAYLTESDSQAEQAMRNPNIFTSESGTETAVAFLPANANEKIFSADVLAAYSGTEEKNQQQNSSVTAC